MTETDAPDATDDGRIEPDGGVAAGRESADYLNAEINIFDPATPFMRDHLRIIWTGFLAWAVIVFGPVTLTALAPGVMTSTMPLVGFPLHYFLVAIGAPGGALILSFWYARKRDALDEEYGIDHATAARSSADDAAAADGGVTE